MHIILDIDNTLIDSLDIISYNRVKDLVKIPDHIGNGMFIWERPYLGNFLNYLDKNIKYISIWTNANKEWLHFILHTVLSKYLKPERFSLLLNIESIEVDEIDLRQMLWTHSEYKPQYPLSYVKEQKKQGILLEDTKKNCVNLGWNGSWSISFTSPFYIWLLENI